MATMRKVGNAIDLAGAASTLVLGNSGSGTTGLVCFQVVGSITATITVQASGDGTTWVSALARSVGSTTSSASITAAGIYQVEASGVEIRLSWPGGETGTPVIWSNAVIG